MDEAFPRAYSEMNAFNFSLLARYLVHIAKLAALAEPRHVNRGTDSDSFVDKQGEASRMEARGGRKRRKTRRREVKISDPDQDHSPRMPVGVGLRSPPRCLLFLL